MCKFAAHVERNANFFFQFRITNIFKARPKSLIFQLWVYFFYIFCCGIRATHTRCVKWRRPAAGLSTVFQRGVVLHFYPLKTIPCQGCAELLPSLSSTLMNFIFCFLWNRRNTLIHRSSGNRGTFTNQIIKKWITTASTKRHFGMSTPRRLTWSIGTQSI